MTVVAPQEGEPAAPRHASPWPDAAVRVAVVLGTAQVAFAVPWITGALPRDLNLAWAPLPAALDAAQRGDVGALAGLALAPGGWLVAATAVWLTAVGVGPSAFYVWTCLWLALWLTAVGALARRFSGSATSAVVWIASVPVVVLEAREGWVHAPEAALVALAAAALLDERPTRRPLTVFVAAAGGALALLLRPSGALWVATLVPLLVAAAWERRSTLGPSARVVTPSEPALPGVPLPREDATPAWPGALVIAAVWAAAATVPARALPMYLAGKIGVRSRYMLTVEGLGGQVVSQIGVVALAVLFVLLALALARGAAWVFERRRAWLLTTWLVLPFLLAVGQGAGLDNFPLFAVALALFVSSLAGPPAWPLLVAGWAIATAARVPGELGRIDAGAAERVTRLVEAACPERRPADPCVIVADNGFVVPWSEEPGRLELALLGVRDVRFVPAHLPAARQLDALVTWQCPNPPPTRGEGGVNLRRRIEELSLVSLREARVGDCTLEWWTRPVEAKPR